MRPNRGTSEQSCSLRAGNYFRRATTNNNKDGKERGRETGTGETVKEALLDFCAGLCWGEGDRTGIGTKLRNTNGKTRGGMETRCRN